ncbi:MAG TPA: hypothetical protein VGR29_04125 [Thermomicrobiales bacterium]|nr:hypothetical protein [Thermomicrobiales bacterium]
MDYVVFGTGYGATLMLLGWALRTFGPGARYQDSGDGSVMGADAILARISWRRFAAALGSVIITAGASLILVTVALILINPGDETGALIALICFALILLAVAVWTWLYVGRYGTHGILPERREEPAVVPARGMERVEPTAAMAIDGREADGISGTQEPDDDIYEEPGIGEDHDGFAAVTNDDISEYDELESRYAKFLLHHPDDVVTVQQVHEDASAEILEDRGPSVADVNGNEVPEEAEELAAYGDPPDIEAPDDRLTAVIPDFQPVSNDEPQTVDTIHISLNEDRPMEDVQLDDSSPTPDVNDLESDEEPLPGDVTATDGESDESGRALDLQDTEEGRAEALRRLHAWQPPDTEEKNS